MSWRKEEDEVGESGRLAKKIRSTVETVDL
jgi:hypothetical protein